MELEDYKLQMTLKKLSGELLRSFILQNPIILGRGKLSLYFKIP